MLKGYYRLGRPINALAGVLAVYVSAYAAGANNWWPVTWAAVTVLLITVSTNAWNDYLDIEIDRINKPERPLPAGIVSPRGALLFSIAGTGLSLLIAALINLPAFIIALGSNVLLYLYSWKLKCTVLAGNAAVGAIVGLCFIFGGVAAGNVEPTVMLALTVFIAIMGREILKTMADYGGDLEHNCTTISTAWGREKAGLFAVIFFAAAAIMMAVLFFTESYGPVYLIIILLVKWPLYAYVGLQARKSRSGNSLEKASTLLKYGFFAWFVAVVLGVALGG